MAACRERNFRRVSGELTQVGCPAGPALYGRTYWEVFVALCHAEDTLLEAKNRSSHRTGYEVRLDSADEALAARAVATGPRQSL